MNFNNKDYIHSKLESLNSKMYRLLFRYTYENEDEEYLYEISRNDDFLNSFLAEFKYLIYSGSNIFYCYDNEIKSLSGLFHSSRVCEDLYGKLIKIMNEYNNSKEKELNDNKLNLLEDY